MAKLREEERPKLKAEFDALKALKEVNLSFFYASIY